MESESEAVVNQKDVTPPAKKPVAKKAPKKTKLVVVKGKASPELFREGSTKADIWSKIKDGKVHSRKSLREFVEKQKKTAQLIAWVLIKAQANGYKVVEDKEDKDKLQVVRK